MTYECDIPDAESLIEARPRARRPAEPLTPEQLAERAAAAEAERLGRRAVAKEAKAKAALALGRHSEISLAMSATEVKKESLANSHVAGLGPIQKSLQEIERRQIAEIVGKQSSDPDLEQRRKSLLEEISRRNAELESAIAAEDRLLGVLYEERRIAGQQSGDSVSTAELIATARADLAVGLQVARSRNDWAIARLRAAEESRRNPAWRAGELADASAACVISTRQMEAALQAVLDE